MVVTLKNPTGNFLFNMGWGDAVIVDSASAGSNKSKPVGTGPFTFKRWLKATGLNWAKIQNTGAKNRHLKLQLSKSFLILQPLLQH